MKKFLALSAVALLVFSGCKKDEADPNAINSVSTDYKAFIVEFTATWCPYCGTNGYPYWEEAFTDRPNKVTGLSIHPADGLVDADYPEFDSLSNFYSCSGYPTTGWNTTGNGYPSATYFNAVDPAITANAQAKAGIGLKTSLSGTTMTVNTKTVVFSDLTGTYALAVYLTEDNLVYDQTTTTTTIPDAVHMRVFRGAADHKPFGTNIINGSATKGTQIDGTYTITVPSDVVNTSNLHVTVVLYKVGSNGRPTEMVNSNYM